MKAALYLSAVDEAVDVAGVHGLSVLSTGAFTHCRDERIPSLAAMTETLTRRTEVESVE